MLQLDVLTVSDFRLPGGTNHSTAQELVIHRQMGIRTGLVQSNSRLASQALPWAPVIAKQLSPGEVDPLLPGTAVDAKVALLRHPITVDAMPDISKQVNVDRALIIANQPAVRGDGTSEYDVQAITQIAQERLGVEPIWAPIGPVVRTSLEPHKAEVRLLPFNWTNIFAPGRAPAVRHGFNRDRPRIGRHSRPQPAKWPDSAQEILQAYPAGDDYDVRILGGAQPALDILGEQPSNWLVHPFGSLDPATFLDEVDFWVYFHHPAWSEAYGRAIMEALWSGAVVILPEHFRVTYGASAVYGTPAQVRRIIEEFRNGERDYLRQSSNGQKFARAHAPDLHIARMRELLESEPRTSAPPIASDAGVNTSTLRPPRINLTTDKRPPSSRFETDRRPRALFVTSNGAGMGHLTRMLGLARAAAGHVAPIFFSMSQGVDVVSAAGFPFEYVPFSSALQTKSELWHEYLSDRLLTAIDQYEAEIVLFDGTWPYRGMLDALQERALLRVWIRRGMWKSNISSEQLVNAPHFDLVIEPGEHAHAFDVGATSQVQSAQVVSPMTILSSHELLPREEALAELGLPNAQGQKYALVTLGAGNINDLTSTQSEVLEALRGQAGWEPVVTRTPITAPAQRAAARTISTFPLARYTRAFDFAISAAGYNAFAESMVGSLPTVWIPNLSTMTDDQDARARWAAEFGYGLRASEGLTTEIHSTVELMCDDTVRGSLVERLQELKTNNGAAEAADLLLQAWHAHQQSKGVLL